MTNKKIYLTDRTTPNQLVSQVREKDRDIIGALTLMLLTTGKYTLTRIKSELEERGIEVEVSTVQRWTK